MKQTDMDCMAHLFVPVCFCVQFLTDYYKRYLEIHRGALDRLTYAQGPSLNHSVPGACFSKVPKLFGRHNSLCIFKTKASRGTKLYGFLISKFYEWLFGPEKFSGRSKNRPLVRVARSMVSVNYHGNVCVSILNHWLARTMLRATDPRMTLWLYFDSVTEERKF